jgi:hypothetical protein
MTKWDSSLASIHKSINVQNIHRTIERSSYWVWCYTPVIPVFWRQRQDDHKFEARLGYIARWSHTHKNEHGGSRQFLLLGRQKSWHGGKCLSSPAIWGSTNRRIAVQAGLGMK